MWGGGGGGHWGHVPPSFHKLLYKLFTTLCVVSNCAPPQSKSLSYAHVGMNVHTSHRYRNWGTDTGCMYLPNTFELLLHCAPSKKHILYHSHIILVIKIHENMVVTSLFLTISPLNPELFSHETIVLAYACL